MAALDRLNFQLAYKRVLDELVDQRRSGRAFVTDVSERDLVEMDLDAWLDDLKNSVANRDYSPTDIELCGAPKGGELVRPAARMSLADRVVYTAAVGACLKHIVAATRWSQRTVDFAPLFHATHPHQRQWLLKPFVGWEAWTKQSLEKLALAKTRFVVTADIAGYFENVSISQLRSELIRIGCSPDVIELISRCLTHWALVRDRGLPQGVLASDVLAKLYLESFDKRIKVEGHAHVRYTDDIRVFCRSRAEARGVLVLVTELLRERGLTVQSAKTGIRPANETLRMEFEGAVPAIKALHREYIQEALDAGILPEDEVSIPASAIDDLVNAEPDSMDPEIFRRAFATYVTDAGRPNRSMFRYLLRRFASSGDHEAVEYCSDELRRRPEATPEILRYFEELERPRDLEVPVRAALTSRDLQTYPYARFLLLGWLFRNGTSRAPTLAAVRRQAFRPENPDYVQAEARRVLGRLGDHADLDQIASLLSSSRDPLERAQLLCCLGRLEKGSPQRACRALEDGKAWGVRAARLVKQG